MAFPPNIAKLLGEYENIYNKKHLLGLLAELDVVTLYLKKGFSLKSLRKKYFSTEIDIVMESSEKLILIEVKYTTHSDYLSSRMSVSQRRRLENVFLRFIQNTSKEVEFHYVIVSQSGEIQVFDDFLSN